MQRRIAFSILTVLGLVLPALGASGDAPRLWSAHVQPLLAENCFKCHGNIETKAGLNLMTIGDVLKGGDSGAVVVPGKPAQSALYSVLLPDADPHMPPKGKSLSVEEIALVKRWIEKLSSNELAVAASAVPSLFRKSTWEPPPGMTPAQAIDFQIEKRWRELKVKPSERCDDRTYCRRVYLDLAGRIPTPEELESFLADRRREKRAALVEALLTTPDYAQHLREIFDAVLMERGAFQTARDRRRNPGRKDLTDRWHDYLEWSFAQNRPWNEIVRDLVLARPASDERRGAIQFLYARKDNAQQMAEAAGSAFLGVQVKCAQCHDHPLAPEIYQSHYWGLVAAFNRSKAVDTGAGPGVAESAIGGFNKFTNLKGGSAEARVRFLDDSIFQEPWPAEGQKEEDAPAKYVNAVALGEGKNLKQVPVPMVSRREQLANWITATNNPLMARAFVNRMWALLMGRGLVHPVDRMDSSRPPSHPELLDWLADDFARSGYDVKRLVRTLCATRVYQLGSRPATKERPPADSFATAFDKPLTAEAFARSVLLATGHTIGTNEPAATLASELQRAFVEVFPDVFPTENVSSPRQALFLSNNKTFNAAIQSSSTNLLVALASKDDAAAVRTIFLRVLNREPDSAERKRAVEFLQSRSERPEFARQQLLWSLITSAEFRMNK